MFELIDVNRKLFTVYIPMRQWNNCKNMYIGDKRKFMKVIVHSMWSNQTINNNKQNFNDIIIYLMLLFTIVTKKCWVWNDDVSYESISSVLTIAEIRSSNHSIILKKFCLHSEIFECCHNIMILCEYTKSSILSSASLIFALHTTVLDVSFNINIAD